MVASGAVDRAIRAHLVALASCPIGRLGRPTGDAGQWLRCKGSALNGQVSAIFQRNSVAGTELTAWLRSIVAKRQFGW